jgi:hypothetical protein
MKSKSRRYEVLLPVRFNDGRDVPDELLGEAVNISMKNAFRYLTSRLRYVMLTNERVTSLPFAVPRSSDE